MAVNAELAQVGPHLLHRDFEQRANDIINLIADLRRHVDLSEVLTQAWERFVEREANADMRRFSEVIADARRQAMIQRQLDDDRELLHHGRLNHDELTSLGHHYEMLRYQACTYNHLLRGVIEHYRDQFGRHDLTTWLTSASQGVHTWAVGEVTGAVSEIALHAALVGLPELTQVRYGTVKEDLLGYDFVVQWQGGILTVDAKTGLYHPLFERKHGHRHLEVSVPREAIEDLHITRRALDILRHEVREALHTSTGTYVHASHHHFRHT